MKKFLRWFFFGVILFGLGFFSQGWWARWQRFAQLKTLRDYREEQISKGAWDRLDQLPLYEKILNFRQFTLPLNNPDIVAAADANHMNDRDTVVGVFVGGQARAYPWWIMSNYHVVNDVVGTIPLLVTLCEACSASAAFDARVEGFTAPLDFSSANVGVGFGTFQISDSATGSVWHPFLGISRMGRLKGTRLRRLESKVTTWENWRALYPKTDVVFASDRMRSREHGMLGSWEMGEPALVGVLATVANLKDKRLPTNAVVYGLIGSVDPGSLGTPKAKGRAYPLESLRAPGQVIKDNFEGADVAIVRTSRFGVRAYKTELLGQKLDLNVVSENPVILKDQTGRQFDEWGFQLKDSGHRGELRLSPVNGYVTEWYEWVSAFPSSEIYSRETL